MIKIIKPLEVPNVLVKKGREETKKNCTMYDENSADYRSGRKKMKLYSSIYGEKCIKDTLRCGQNKKCCYCESKFAATSYGAVEHFRPKGAVKQGSDELQKYPKQYPGYYWLAYDWSNLFLSCECCNTNKSMKFPLEDDKTRARSHNDPICRERPLLVNPAIEDPREHIYFCDAIAKHYTCSGEMTIKILNLMRRDLEEARKEKLALLKGLWDAIAIFSSKSLCTLQSNNVGKKQGQLDESVGSKAECIDKQKELYKNVKNAKELLDRAVCPEAEFSSMAQDLKISRSQSILTTSP